MSLNFNVHIDTWHGTKILNFYLAVICHNVKGVVDFFFLGLIVFMGCSLTFKIISIALFTIQSLQSNLSF